ncbi:hypothetical protein [Simkania sp.]|uniref:hypothetical protein n=1 Tax=Simkania sp. TaxID=34094 RepID=UPI003B51F6F1
MRKLLFVFVSICLIAMVLFKFREKVALEESPLPIALLDASGHEDADWVFETEVDGQKKSFIVYQWIIKELCRPENVSLNLTDCDDQWIAGYAMSSDYLGKTEEGVHLLLALDRDSWHHVLLFLEVLKGEGVSLDGDTREEFTFYSDQVLLKKVGCIPLPGYIHEKEIAFDGNKLEILYETYDLDLTPPSKPELIKGRLPLHFDRAPYINPRLIDDFSSSMRTGGSVMIACDLEQAQKAPAYDFLGNGLTAKYGQTCEYSYLGRTKNGVHIVPSYYYQCRPVKGYHFMFVFEKDYEIVADWKNKTFKRNKKRTLMKKMGELDLYYLKYSTSTETPFLIQIAFGTISLMSLQDLLKRSNTRKRSSFAT